MRETDLREWSNLRRVPLLQVTEALTRSPAACLYYMGCHLTFSPVTNLSLVILAWERVLDLSYSLDLVLQVLYHFSLTYFWHLSVYWSIGDLQCYLSFFCTAKWLSFVCVYIFYILFQYGLSMGLEYSSLCCISRPLLSIHPTWNSSYLLTSNF